MRTATARLDAANLTVELLEDCASTVRARVRNVGLVPAPASAFAVRFHLGDLETGEDLGTVAVPAPLDAGASVIVEKSPPEAPIGIWSAFVEPLAPRTPFQCSTVDDFDATVLCLE